jgi:hypothetical protein
MDPVEITSLSALITHIQSVRRHPRQELWFRGQRVTEWRVEPAVQRGYSRADERTLTNRFRARAEVRYSRAPAYDDSGHWLSIMQHYGLPTRLLDWSRSPLIATYFAVRRHMDSSSEPVADASLWILDPIRLNVSEDYPPITPAIDAHGCKEILVPAFTDSDPEVDKVRAVMAIETDLRILIQQGCFTIHSRREPLDGAPRSTEYLQLVRIPAAAIKAIADELEVCALRRADLFPDLANLAGELKGLYTPARARRAAHDRQ